MITIILFFLKINRKKIKELTISNKVFIDSLCAHFLIEGGLLRNSSDNQLVKKIFL